MENSDLIQALIEKINIEKNIINDKSDYESFLKIIIDELSIISNNSELIESKFKDLEEKNDELSKINYNSEKNYWKYN